ncbi:hypothetical protein OROGR_019495 [Orobanche gracilis]
MATKMKGLFKGLRYISQIFEEDKDQEMQIGFPTDVKHVAHIGWDGPTATAVDSSPSWMKEFKSPTGFQSAPLGSNGNNREDPEVKWVSEDSKKGNRVTHSPGRDLPEVPRSSRRHNNNSSDNNNSNDSPRKKDSSTKSRQSRRNHSNEPGQPSDSPSRAHPDLAKKSRRKKSKEADCGGSTRSNKSNKDPEGSGSSRSRSKPACCGPSYSDHGLDNGSVSRTPGSPLGPISSKHDEEKERRVIS